MKTKKHKLKNQKSKIKNQKSKIKNQKSQKIIKKNSKHIGGGDKQPKQQTQRVNAFEGVVGAAQPSEADKVAIKKFHIENTIARYKKNIEEANNDLLKYNHSILKSGLKTGEYTSQDTELLRSAELALDYYTKYLKKAEDDLLKLQKEQAGAGVGVGAGAGVGAGVGVQVGDQVYSFK